MLFTFYPKKIRKFRGLIFTPFHLKLSSFDGFGFSFMEFEIQSQGKVCVIGYSRELLGIHFGKCYQNDGCSFNIRANIFFIPINWKKVLIEEKDRCRNCDDLCQTKQFYEKGTPYCCVYCAEADK